MSNTINQIKEARQMFREVEIFLSNTIKSDILERIDRWSSDGKIVGTEKNKSLPLLVMSSGGLPKPLNALFFKLK